MSSSPVLIQRVAPPPPSRPLQVVAADFACVVAVTPAEAQVRAVAAHRRATRAAQFAAAQSSGPRVHKSVIERTTAAQVARVAAIGGRYVPVPEVTLGPPTGSFRGKGANASALAARTQLATGAAEAYRQESMSAVESSLQLQQAFAEGGDDPDSRRLRISSRGASSAGGAVVVPRSATENALDALLSAPVPAAGSGGAAQWRASDAWDAAAEAAAELQLPAPGGPGQHLPHATLFLRLEARVCSREEFAQAYASPAPLAAFLPLLGESAPAASRDAARDPASATLGVVASISASRHSRNSSLGPRLLQRRRSSVAALPPTHPTLEPVIVADLLTQLVADAVADPDLGGLLQVQPLTQPPPTTILAEDTRAGSARSDEAVQRESSGALITGVTFDDIRRAHGDSSIAAVAATVRAARWRGIGLAPVVSEDSAASFSENARPNATSSHAALASACANTEFRDFSARLVESAILQIARDVVSGSVDLRLQDTAERRSASPSDDTRMDGFMDESDEAAAQEARLQELLSQDDNV
jgi:hypothetical protein